MANILRSLPNVTDITDLNSFLRDLQLYLTQKSSIAWKIVDKTQSTITDIGNKSHTLLTDIGVNTHAQIDTFIADKNNPTQVTKAQIGLGNVENTALSTWAGTTNITTVGTLTGGSTGTGFTISLSISTITGILGVVNGGTAQNTWTLGDILYASGANALSKLAGNITITRNFLRQTGTGLISAAPIWDTLLAADVPTLNQNTTGTASNITGLLALTNIVLGAANTKLFTNSGATAAEWAKGFKVGSFTRDVSTTAGNQSITGVGFKGSSIIVIGTDGVGGGLSHRCTIGFDDGTTSGSLASIVTDTSAPWIVMAGQSIYCGRNGLDDVKAHLTSWDSDGFTLIWTNTGSGVFTFYYIIFR